MKKFIKNSFYAVLLAVSSFGTTGCDTKTAAPADDSSVLFYNVVYQAVSTRENSNKAWVGVNGVMQMKISQNTADQGTFIFFYRTYKEPQFVYNVCSGGYKGNFTIPADSTAAPTPSNYSVLTTYAPDANTTTVGQTTSADGTTTNADGTTTTVAVISNYTFAFTITFRSLDAACRPESDRVVGVYRFTNGQIILKSEYRDILMRPVLTSETQIQ